MGHYAEDDEYPILPGPDSGYLLIVQDDHQQCAYWHEDWKQLEDLTYALAFFQEIEEPPDWDVLLKDLRTLRPLRSGEDHPLSDYCDFDLWPFFMYLVTRHDLFGSIHHVYFDESTPKGWTKAFLDECSTLKNRLRHYEPLRRFWDDMPK